jgi:hypothetical protein
MTVEHLALICVGFTFNALTFALGILVGSSMRKQD